MVEFDDALLIKPQNAPSTPTVGPVLYASSVDGHIHQLDTGGVDVDITAAGGSSTLTEAAAPSFTPQNGVTQPYANLFSGRFGARDDNGADAMIDFRRARGYEQRQWRAALAGRFEQPANIFILGDSVSEGAMASSFSNTYVDIFRAALQKEYRDGGVGFIPALQNVGLLFANQWTGSGAPTTTDYGPGWGRRSIFLNSASADAITTTQFCDRFWIVYSSTPTSGTIRVTVDGVVLGTQSAVSTMNKGGVIYDSGPLPVLGNHTIKVDMSAGLAFVEGGVFFNTDALNGIHVWNGGHGGFQSANFNGDTAEDVSASVGARRAWAQTWFQPYAITQSGAGSVSATGTTTLTWTGGTFDNNDIGEVVFGGTDVNGVPQGMRIVSVNSTTSIVVNKTVATGTYTMAATRSRVTNASTISGSQVVTSATMAFNAWDVGKTVSGTNIPTGTVIKSIDSPTQITISIPATGTTTGTGTLQIKNRQKFPNRPHLFILEFSGNEMVNYGVSKSLFKTQMQAVYQTGIDTGQIDLPTMTGIYNDERPSVVLLNMWATAYTASYNTTLATVNGSTTVNKATTGAILETRFTTADIGKTITCANFPGSTTTITGVTVPPGQFYSDSATVSPAANATSTNVAATVLTRNWQDAQFQDFRSAMFEMADANQWSHFDLYNIGGYAGIYDYQRLVASDGIHPNNRGYQWIADELTQLVGGVKKLASISAGIFNNAGEMIKATSADNPRVVPGIKRLTAAVSSGSTVGTYVDLTELAFPLAPNETLTFQFYILYATPVNTSGITFRLNASANTSTPAAFVMGAVAPGTVSTFTYVGPFAPTAWPQTAITATGSAGASIIVPFQIYGTITAGAYGGIVTPQVTPEVAASAASVQRGSFALIL